MSSTAPKKRAGNPPPPVPETHVVVMEVDDTVVLVEGHPDRQTWIAAKDQDAYNVEDLA